MIHGFIEVPALVALRAATKYQTFVTTSGFGNNDKVLAARLKLAYSLVDEKKLVQVNTSSPIIDHMQKVIENKNGK